MTTPHFKENSIEVLICETIDPFQIDPQLDKAEGIQGFFGFYLKGMLEKSNGAANFINNECIRSVKELSTEDFFVIRKLGCGFMDPV